MLRLSLHECFYFYYTILLCVTFVCFSLFGFHSQLLTLHCAWFHMSVSSLPYIVFVNGASRSTQNLVSFAWAIYAPTNELISLQGVFLGRATNNIAEYSIVIELLTDVISLGIRHFIVRLDS
jgi:hypothetical protein